jgi:hypothetical protein
MSDNVTPEQLALIISKSVVKALKPKAKKTKKANNTTGAVQQAMVQASCWWVSAEHSGQQCRSLGPECGGQ